MSFEVTRDLNYEPAFHNGFLEGTGQTKCIQVILQVQANIHVPNFINPKAAEPNLLTQRVQSTHTVECGVSTLGILS